MNKRCMSRVLRLIVKKLSPYMYSSPINVNICSRKSGHMFGVMDREQQLQYYKFPILGRMKCLKIYYKGTVDSIHSTIFRNVLIVMHIFFYRCAHSKNVNLSYFDIHIDFVRYI
jgi:hypothetical protein